MHRSFSLRGWVPFSRSGFFFRMSLMMLAESPSLGTSLELEIN